MAVVVNEYLGEELEVSVGISEDTGFVVWSSWIPGWTSIPMDNVLIGIGLG